MRTPALVFALLACVASAARAQHPMYIINGVRIDKCEGALNTTGGDRLPLADIDPNAIENIEVVKGAMAARIYGADAVNGVISITMKKGAVVSPTLCGTPKIEAPVCIVDGSTVPPERCGMAPAARPAQDPIARYLYAPELVIAHQEAIGLTDRQRAAIQDAVKDVQSKVLDAQLKLASGGEKLSKLLAASVVDEASVLQQIDQVLASEREVKRAQMTLLVRIKNQLTAAQQGMLDKMR